MPPTINHDRTHASGGQLLGLERVLDFDQSDGSGEDDYTYEADTSQLFELQNASAHTQEPYSAGLGAFNTPPFSEKAYSQHELGYDEVQPMPLQVSDSSYIAQDIYHPPQCASLPPTNGGVWTNEQMNATDLSNLMGGLGIANDGVGMCKVPLKYRALSNCTLLISKQLTTYLTKRRLWLILRHTKIWK